MRLGGEGLGGHDQQGGEVSHEGNYQGQKKEESRSKKSFSGYLKQEEGLLDGCPLSLSARCRCDVLGVFVRVALWSHVLA